MNNTVKAILIASAVLGVIYILLAFFANSGYGYMGYYGYHRGSSSWHMGGSPVYYDRSIRNGSISGANVRGGGFGSGK